MISRPTFDPNNKEHKAIVLGAIAAADAFGAGRISSAREMLHLNDIDINDVDLFQRMVGEWGRLIP
jgi:hypothetical protein